MSTTNTTPIPSPDLVPGKDWKAIANANKARLDAALEYVKASGLVTDKSGKPLDHIPVDNEIVTDRKKLWNKGVNYSTIKAYLKVDSIDLLERQKAGETWGGIFVLEVARQIFDSVAVTPAAVTPATPAAMPAELKAQLEAEIARLTAENSILAKNAVHGGGNLGLKVSDKGALSVYGMGRFPVTLYREQWEKLLASADIIRAFISEHEGVLKKKEDKVKEDAAKAVAASKSNPNPFNT